VKRSIPWLVALFLFVTCLVLAGIAGHLDMAEPGADT
jgi:hypothetical protein